MIRPASLRVLAMVTTPPVVVGALAIGGCKLRADAKNEHDRNKDEIGNMLQKAAIGAAIFGLLGARGDGSFSGNAAQFATEAMIGVIGGAMIGGWIGSFQNSKIKAPLKAAT